MSQRTYYSESARRRAQRQQFIVSLAVAGVSLSVGAIIALLFAPESGDEIRAEIRDQLEELMASGNETSQEIAQEVKEKANYIRNTLNERVNS